jgi:hypothetical protein
MDISEMNTDNTSSVTRFVVFCRHQNHVGIIIDANSAQSGLAIAHSIREPVQRFPPLIAVPASARCPGVHP